MAGEARAAVSAGFVDSGNIVDVIRSHAAATPGYPAVIDRGREISYLKLQELIAGSAGHLAGLGLRQGDRLGLVLQDHADHLVLILAAASLGAAAVSLNWRSKIEEKQVVADSFGIRFLVTDVGARSPPGIRAVPIDEAWRSAVERAIPLEPLASASTLPFRILLTSGTTGAPKGVELTHAGAMAWCASVRMALGLRAPQRHLSVLPLAFSGSLVFNLLHLLVGNVVELFPPLFTTEELIAVVRSRGITSAIVVPTILRRLLALAPEYGLLLPELEYLVSLGAPLAADEKRAIAQSITTGFFDHYGASGSGPISFLAPAEIDAKADSVGRPMPLKEVQMVDKVDRPLPPGEMGLLRCRGPGMATGFCNAGDESASETFRDGWYYPGELARFDEDGFIYIVGRASELILHGGNNVYPAEVERALSRHPAVIEAAVTGVASEEYGEDVIAFVHLARAVPERDLMEICRRYLTPYKVPKEIIPVDQIPKTSVGKVLKSELLRLARPARSDDDRT